MRNMISEQLQEAALLMDKQIKRKLHPAIGNQNPTARRARIAAGMYEDGMILARQQRALLALAAGHQDGSLPMHMRGITTKRQVIFLLKFERWNQDPDCFEAMLEIFKNGDHYVSARNILHEMIDTKDLEEQRRKRELLNKELDLIGQVAGYFPTPSNVVDVMTYGLKLSSVFDPTAGGGRILDRVKELFPACITSGIEINHTLAEIARTKGHKVITGDIFETPLIRHPMIIMNPPFENHADEKIVTYVYDRFLDDGGVLISVLAGNKLESKSEEFQEMVNRHGDWQDLPKDSFKKSKTGVATMIVRLTK